MDFDNIVTYRVIRTKPFNDWYDKLKDNTIKFRVDETLAKIRKGNLGVSEPVGDGVSEVKLHFGPGYRLYYIMRGKEVIILLCGGTKSTQDKDIKKAKELAKEYRL